jgi:hypothetical protein
VVRLFLQQRTVARSLTQWFVGLGLVVTEVMKVPVVQVEDVVPWGLFTASLPRAGANQYDRPTLPVHPLTQSRHVDATLQLHSGSTRGVRDVMEVGKTVDQRWQRILGCRVSIDLTEPELRRRRHEPTMPAASDNSAMRGRSMRPCDGLDTTTGARTVPRAISVTL